MFNPVKFHGKFKELIPAGFKFQKLYANNYRQYSISEDKNGYGATIRVWQHHGGYIEIDNVHGYENLIFKIFSDPVELEKYKIIYNTKIVSGNYYVFMINKKTNNIEIMDKNSPNCEYYPIRKLTNKEITEAQSDEMSREYYDTYTRFVVSDDSWLFKYIKHMIDIGWVKP